MNLNNLKKIELHYKPESVVRFEDVNYDLFLVTSTMRIFNPMNDTVNYLKLTDGNKRLPYQIFPRRRLNTSDSVFENIYFIRFRRSLTTEEKLMLNEIRVNKVIISGWNGETNWLLPF